MGSEWWKKDPIAHRGLHQGHEIPENSLSAFEKAVAAKHPIELDIITLSDGTPAVFHDDELRRLTNVCGETRGLKKEHLSLLRLYQGTQKIPTLNDVCDFVKGRVPLMIEIKSAKSNGKEEQAVYEVIKNYAGEVAIQSFNPYVVLWFKKNAPHIVRGLLSYDYLDDESNLSEAKKLMLRHLAFVPMAMPNFLSIEHVYLEAPAVKFYRNWWKIPVISWTVTSKKRREEIAPFCDNIIFEGFNP